MYWATKLVFKLYVCCKPFGVAQMGTSCQYFAIGYLLGILQVSSVKSYNEP